MVTLLVADFFDEMRDLGDHAAHFRRVDTFGDAVHLAQTESPEGLPHLHGTADAAADLPEADGLAAGDLLFDLPEKAHASAPPSGSLPPRRALYCSSVRRSLRASNVALTTLCGLAVPRDLVRMFWMPAD